MAPSRLELNFSNAMQFQKGISIGPSRQLLGTYMTIVWLYDMTGMMQGSRLRHLWRDGGSVTAIIG